MTHMEMSEQQNCFAREIANPLEMYCPGVDQTYSVYQMNQAQEGRPLVVYLGLGTTALTGMGRTYLHEYTQVIDRPIITLHPHAHTQKSFEQRATGDVELLHQLGEGEIDIIGSSSGALLASHVAAQLGASARHLVTVSSVGTKHGYAQYFKGLPGQFVDGLKESRTAIGEQGFSVLGSQSSNFFNVRRYGELAHTVGLVVGATLEEAIEGLDEQTKWRDIVGTNDHMTDYRDHLNLVRERNQRALGSSSVYLLGSQAHMWATKRRLLAELVDGSIGSS